LFQDRALAALTSTYKKKSVNSLPRRFKLRLTEQKHFHFISHVDLISFDLVFNLLVPEFAIMNFIRLTTAHSALKRRYPSELEREREREKERREKKRELSLCKNEREKESIFIEKGSGAGEVDPLSKEERKRKSI
jgi:hypothetical protein